MNISTLAKILGISVKEIKSTAQKKGIHGFSGRNTRVSYNSALAVTKILKPEKLDKLSKDDNKIYLPAFISVADFAESIGKPSGIVVKKLLLSGVMATLNEKIDYDTASLIAEEMRVKVYPESEGQFDNDEEANLIKTVEYDHISAEDARFIDRNPIVTIMGHVDHGKTTLLDFIRKSNVAAGESGAITQHISSYKITHKNQKITFVDTPGHEAFTAMRARGSQLADFVILVVSATEGPKPQTVEVIERCKLSKVPVIVAINKVDLPEADPEKVKTDITKFGLVPEEWGGETPFVNISAKTGQGINDLLNNILLHAEVSELKGQVNCPGQGVVIESHLDNKLGVVSTVLVVKDKIKTSDIIRSGEFVGKVRRLENDMGKTIQQAEIGDPVLLIGLPNVIDVGEPVIVYDKQKQAQTDASLEKRRRASKIVTNFNQKNTENQNGQINLILKADVSGSLEALKESIIKIPQDQVKLVIKQESVGEVNQNDIEFAATTESTILAFHTKINPASDKLIQNLQVNIVASEIIYELLEWIEEEMLKHIKHEIKLTSLGKAKILAVFKSPKPQIQVIGGEVLEGKIFSNKELIIHRDGKEMGRAEIEELQRNKDKVSEINVNQQFGVSVNSKVKIKTDDIIECIEEEVVK